MSGAALFAGPFLIGIVIIDPPRFGADRVMAVPVAPLLGRGQFAGLLGVGAGAALANLSLRLGELGRREEALAAIEEVMSSSAPPRSTSSSEPSQTTAGIPWSGGIVQRASMSVAVEDGVELSARRSSRYSPRESHIR